MSGFDIIDEIKKRNIESRIIIITAYKNKNVTERAKTLGVSLLFEKPFDVNTVIKDIFI